MKNPVGNNLFNGGFNTENNRQKIHQSRAFDANFYASNYGPWMGSFSDPLEHYLKIGYGNFWSPSAYFDGVRYAGEHPDVMSLKIPGLLHWLEERQDTGLIGPHGLTSAEEVEVVSRFLEEADLLDPVFYNAIYTDVQAAGVNPVWHYVTSGAFQNRDPGPNFNAKDYVSSTDGELFRKNPALDWLVRGLPSGRGIRKSAWPWWGSERRKQLRASAVPKIAVYTDNPNTSCFNDVQRILSDLKKTWKIDDQWFDKDRPPTSDDLFSVDFMLVIESTSQDACSVLRMCSSLNIFAACIINHDSRLAPEKELQATILNLPGPCRLNFLLSKSDVVLTSNFDLENNFRTQARHIRFYRESNFSTVIEDVLSMAILKNFDSETLTATRGEGAALAKSSGQVSSGLGVRHRPLRVVGIGDGLIPSIEMGIQIPFRELMTAYGVDARFYIEPVEMSPADLADIDVLYVQRCFKKQTMNLIDQAIELGVSVVYALDDNIWNVERASPLWDFYASHGAFDNISGALMKADVVLTFCQPMKDAMTPRSRRVEKIDSVCGVEIFDRQPAPKRSAAEREEIRIGYAGSPTHATDLDIVRDVVNYVLDTHNNVVIESIGQNIPWLEGHPRYRYFPGVDGIENYIKLQSSRNWDIGIAPFVRNEFNDAKTDNKYRFFAAAGIPSVYTDLPALKDSVTQNVTGIVVTNSDENWKKALDLLINNREKRLKIRSKALEDVRERFSVRTVTKSLFDIFQELRAMPKILVVGHCHLPSFQIDIVMPFGRLARAGAIKYQLRYPYEFKMSDLDWADLVVLVRAAEPLEYDILKAAQARGIKVVVSWDDNFFGIPEEDKALHGHYNAPEIQRAMKSILREADLVKASTPLLGELSKTFNDNVVVYPYGFEFDLIPGPVEADPSSVVIGYFGSPGRGAEFNIVTDALFRICAEYPHVKIEMFGFRPGNLENFDKANFIPFVEDYAASLKAVHSRGWSLAVAPLASNEVARMKLPTKYRDYGALGIPAVYSCAEAYVNVVQDGVTGLLADNTVESWYRALKQLVDDPALRSRIRNDAEADVRENYGVELALSAWRNVFRQMGLQVR